MILILAVELCDSLYDLQVSNFLCLGKIRFRAGNSRLELLLAFKKDPKTHQKKLKNALPLPLKGDPCSNEKNVCQILVGLEKSCTPYVAAYVTSRCFVLISLYQCSTIK